MASAQPPIPRPVSFMSKESSEDMARRRGQRKGYLRPENGNWLFTYRIYTREHPKGHRLTVTIGPADGAGKLTKKQAERFAYEHYLQPLDTATVKPMSTMTVGEFWGNKYEPHLRKAKKYATQSQYISIWKQWISPVVAKIRLFELTPDHVDKCINDALAAGKSSATAKHIRKVASAIWSHAKRMQCASGDNPAQAIEAITVEPVRTIQALTAEQCRLYLSRLPEPARTMCIVSLGVSMNVSELLGLREKHANFTDQYQPLEAPDVVPPHEISVREHLYHARRGSLKTGKRRRNLPMTPEIEAALQALIATNMARGPETPVFQTSVGTSQSADNLCKRVLKVAVDEINAEYKAKSRKDVFPAVTWHVLRHTHATLTKSAGMSDYDRQRLMGHASADMTDRYTHEDRERIRTGVQKVVSQIMPAIIDTSDQQLTSEGFSTIATNGVIQ